ncbi:uncharacterized protein LOC132286614 [Cornus florida]|uniref:uncharacterized protein LOC132286614 n=1 Tax=Cornus florida TaxID=4283 RepID=UPI0028973B56|nr:uncharacterized protein LOC132286614 [Cornus florida]
MSMSTLAVTVTVLLSHFFTFSHARTPLILPANDVIQRHPSHSSPESDTKSTILLPSQKPPSKPVSIPDQFLEPEPINTDTQPIESAVDLPESDAATLSRPTNVVSFRPINRQFRLKRPYPVRFSHHHRCRHRSKTTSPSDVVFPGEKSDLQPVMFRGGGGVRQIPARWVTFHHHHRQHHDARPRFSFKHHRMFEKERFKTGEKNKKNKREGKKGRDERENGFMKRIRKFLITPTF